MRRTARTLMKVALILILIGVALIGFFHKATKKGILNFGEKDIVTGTVDIKAFTSLTVDTASVDFIIEKGDHYAFEYRVPEVFVPEVKQSGKSLTVRQPSARGLFFNLVNTGKIYYKLTVPANSVFDIDVDISSGTFDVSGVSMSGDLKMASGKVVFDNVTYDGKLNISSGNVNFKNVYGSNLAVDMASGNVNLSSCTYASFSMEVSSGNLDVEDCTLTKVYYDATSGGADFEDCFIDTFKYKLSSGHIDLEIHGKETDFDYDMTCTSGKIEVGGLSREKSHIVKYGNSKLISGNAVSGSVKVKFFD